MPDFRSYCETPDRSAAQIVLSPEESFHLVAANRARVGDLVVAFDGKGFEWVATLEAASKRAAMLRIEKRVERAAPSCSIALAQALPKGKLLESIIRRATEIGAGHIYPVRTERVEGRVKAEREDAKNAKWLAAAIEGAKQSGNPFLPKIHRLERFSETLRLLARYDLKLIASLGVEAVAIKRSLELFLSKSDGALPSSAVWLVGPEGDFTSEETTAALAAGFVPVTLGPNVLRCETAAIAALSVLRSELER